jgi:hypothetical protein
MVKVPRGVLGGSGKGVVEGMASEFGGVVEDVENVGMDGGAWAGGEGEEEVLDGDGGAVGGANDRVVATAGGEVTWRLVGESARGERRRRLGWCGDGVVKGVDGGARARPCH